MEPTLQVDDRVLVLKNTFVETNISSGDIVVFYSPQTEFKDDYIEEFIESIQIWKLTNDDTYLNTALIKRVVGSSGDEVTIKKLGLKESNKERKDIIPTKLIWPIKNEPKILAISEKAEIEEVDGKESIIVTEIPYQVNKADMIKKIADLVNDKKLEGISTIRDESDRNGMRIVFVLKRDAIPNVLRLWKLVESIKLELFEYIERYDDIDCYIGESMCDHEGYVISNEFGTYKVVNVKFFILNRYIFFI